MNDSGMSFDEIADYLDKFGSSRYWWLIYRNITAFHFLI
jgi:hypothetical protein